MICNYKSRTESDHQRIKSMELHDHTVKLAFHCSQNRSMKLFSYRTVQNYPRCSTTISMSKLASHEMVQSSIYLNKRATKMIFHRYICRECIFNIMRYHGSKTLLAMKALWLLCRFDIIDRSLIAVILDEHLANHHTGYFC